MRDRGGYLPPLSVAVAFAVMLLSQPAAASQIAEENFRLSFPVYSSSGTGFSGAWTTGGFNAFVSGYTLRQRSLCYPRLENAGASSCNRRAPSTTASSTASSDSPLNGALGSDLFIGKPGGGAGQVSSGVAAQVGQPRCSCSRPSSWPAPTCSRST